MTTNVYNFKVTNAGQGRKEHQCQHHEYQHHYHNNYSRQQNGLAICGTLNATADRITHFKTLVLCCSYAQTLDSRSCNEWMAKRIEFFFFFFFFFNLELLINEVNFIKLVCCPAMLSSGIGS